MLVKNIKVPIVIKLQSFVHISEPSVLAVIASFTQWKEEIELKYEETFMIRKLVPISSDLEKR